MTFFGILKNTVFLERLKISLANWKLFFKSKVDFWKVGHLFFTRFVQINKTCHFLWHCPLNNIVYCFSWGGQCHKQWHVLSKLTKRVIFCAITSLNNIVYSSSWGGQCHIEKLHLNSSLKIALKITFLPCPFQKTTPSIRQLNSS